MGFFDKLKQGLSKTKDSINEKINDLNGSALILKELIENLQEEEKKLERDYNKLSNRTKDILEERYNNIINVLFKK